MGGEWIETTLGNVVELKRGYDLPGRNRIDGVYPIVSSSGISGYHQSAKVKAPGVVTGRYGTLGRVFYITTDFWPLNTALYVRDFKGNDPRFVSYFLQGIDFFAFSDKAAVPGLNRNHLHSAVVRIPPPKEQQAIACILGALDDRIELNRRMNRTLEDMARAIFKSWFVDFDPVRAKAAGRQPPGLKPEIADLFPDSFEDSELGEIPKGWRVGTLGMIAQESREAVKPADIEANFPYIALEHIPKRCIALDSWGTADGVASGKLLFRQGDILFGKLRPYFHKVGPAPVDGVCSTDIVVIRPKNQYWYGLVTGHVFDDAFVAHTDRSSAGTKMPRTNWRDMAAYTIAIPSADLAKRHTHIVLALLDKIRAGIIQSRTLAALRDTLLPKLISGELRVPDAERIAGRAL